MSNAADSGAGREDAASSDFSLVRIGGADSESVSAGQHHAIDPPRGASDVAFDKEVAQKTASFSVARIQSKERVGVLLLLGYKDALDEMNTAYRKYIDCTDSGETTGIEKISAITERYGKAEMLYESHLDRRPASFPTKAAYEAFLVETAAAVLTYRMLQLPTALNNLPAGSNEKLRLGLDLVVRTSSWYERHHHGPDVRRWAENQPTERDVAFAALRQRASFALLGGFALIVPMLVMKLYPTTLNVCLTTTLFVFVAAALLAINMGDTGPKDVLGITAAYAAVLVVFVGTSTTEDGLDNGHVAVVMGAVMAGLIVFTGAIALSFDRKLRWNAMRIRFAYWRRERAHKVSGLKERWKSRV